MLVDDSDVDEIEVFEYGVGDEVLELEVNGG